MSDKLSTASVPVAPATEPRRRTRPAGTAQAASAVDAGRPRNPEETQRRILEAARAEFCEKGFDGARVDAIAERADANKRLLYHYFGNKEALYCAVLEAAHREISEGERTLSLDRSEPEEAMDRLVRFTFRHFLEKPWFISLLTTENLHGARFLKTLKDIPALHSPLVGQLETLIERGAATGVFRSDVDPIQLYITIAALGWFYVSNIATLSVSFGRDLRDFAIVQEREAHCVSVVMDFLRARRG